VLPVTDFVRRRHFPYVNYVLIAINVAVFLYSLSLSTQPDQLIAGSPTSPADRFFLDWGFVPACLASAVGLEVDVGRTVLNAVCQTEDRSYVQVLTAMFVHAGPAHILGNMLFLWIFGDNVEDRLGHLVYLVFYFLCGIAASAAQTFLALDTVVPNVGASGAIAGVLGAYIVLFPTAIVQVVVLPIFFVPFFVPAILVIGFWFVSQVFAGLAEIGRATAGSGVAWWAHVGGFVAGFILTMILPRGPAPPPRQRQREVPA
jgi:membrane associated rhomboid family serine protease